MDLCQKNRIEEVNIFSADSSKYDTDLYYVYQNSKDELYLYFLNMGVYSLNLRTKSIAKVNIPITFPLIIMLLLDTC